MPKKKHTLSQSVEALSDPPCFLIKASKAFSSGYFSLPIKTTEKSRGNLLSVSDVKTRSHAQNL